MRSGSLSIRAIVASLATVAVLQASSPVHAQNAWLPQPGEFVISGTYVFQTYDEFWMGKRKADFPDTDQHTLETTLEYGIFEAQDFALAFDAAFAYVRVIGTRPAGAPAPGAPAAGVNDGLNDVRLGLRFRVLDEFAHDTDFLPTVTVRVGGIIEGTYDVGSPEAPGDGASGVEVSLLAGKEIVDTGPGFLGFYGDVGYRYRAEDVPEDIFFSFFVYQRLCDMFTVSVGYRHVQGLSGPDIGGPGFTGFADFPLVKEISQTVEGGISFHDEGGRDWGIFVADTVEGRNTADRFIVGISVAVPFGGEGTRLPFVDGPRYTD